MLLNVIRQRLWQLFLNAGNVEDHESKGKGGREAIRNRNALERRQEREEERGGEIRRSRALQTKDLGNKLAAVWRSKK